jgi:RNA-directed DNA polymerase
VVSTSLMVDTIPVRSRRNILCAVNCALTIERVISLINPMLRGWVNYFAVGHSSECFSLIKDWVEKKVRRHMAQAQRRQGFGWERWSRRWLYDTLKLFNGYRVRHGGPKVAPAG